MQKRSLGEWIGFAIILPVVTFVSFLIHELAHYSAGELQGLDMWFNLNLAGYEPGVIPTDQQSAIVLAAGPAITIAQAVIAAIFIRSRKHLWLFAIVVVAFWQRAMAFGVTLLNNPNDEARLAMMFGWPDWSLHAAVVGFLGLVTLWAGYKARAGLIANIIAYVMISASITAVVFGNQYVYFEAG